MKIHAIIFTLGLLLGLFFSFMYRTLLIDLPKPTVSKQSVVELKKEVAKADVIYAKNFDSLKKQSAALTGELKTTRKSLQIVKGENLKLTTEVALLIRKQKPRKVEPLIDDSYDSLINTVEHLMLSNAEKDSLYEAATDNLIAQIANKDSTIALKDEQYMSLKSTFGKSLHNQQSLIDENKLLGKQLKKQKAKGKLLSAALFIISGAAIHQFIRR
jgi:hypothetical protein